MTGQDEHIRREVAASLKQASDLQLVRIMQFIDRLPSRRRLDDVVETVRGRLVLVRPARSLTLARVLVLPFEDLLVGSELAMTSPWFIPRDLTAVVTNFMHKALSADRQTAVEAGLAGRTMDELEIVLELGAELWPATADGIDRALKQAAVPQGVSPDLVHPLRGVATILRFGEEIVGFMDQLPPRPMPRLREDQRGSAMSLLYSMGQVSDDMFRYAFTMLVRRAAEPMEFFEMILDADFGIPPALRDLVLTETAKECLHEVDVMQKDMADQPGRPASAAADAALRMASLIESLENAPSQVQVDDKKLADTKAKASQSIVKSFQGTLSGELKETFQSVAKPAGGKAMASDEEVLHAENVARSTRKIELAGGRLGAGANLEQVRNGHFADYRSTIMQKASKTRGPRMTRISSVMDEVRLVEIVFGGDAAKDLLEEIGD